MKRRIFIFILFVIGLAACTAKLAHVMSHDTDTNSFNQHELEISSAHIGNSPANSDGVFGNPVCTTIFAYGNNVYSGHVRTINRCMRLIYRYFPNAFVKAGKVINITVVHNYLSSRNISYPVKLSENHGFIRLRKILI